MKVTGYRNVGCFCVLPEIEVWRIAKSVLIGWLWWCIEIEFRVLRDDESIV